eukprot:543141_1
MRGLYIRCPDRYPNIAYNCILNASGTFNNVDIFSEKNKVLIQGMNSYTSTLHCGYEWFERCDLRLVNGEWQCQDTSSVCNQFVTITSSTNWTFSPSSRPTTAPSSDPSPSPTNKPTSIPKRSYFPQSYI